MLGQASLFTAKSARPSFLGYVISTGRRSEALSTPRALDHDLGHDDLLEGVVTAIITDDLSERGPHG